VKVPGNATPAGFFNEGKAYYFGEEKIKDGSSTQAISHCSKKFMNYSG